MKSLEQDGALPIRSIRAGCKMNDHLLPHSLGSALKPYVKLAALLEGVVATPEQMVDRLMRVSPPLAPHLAAPPDPQALVRDLLHLRLIEPLENGMYRCWGYLAGAIEVQALRYVALTLLVPLPDGTYDLPVLRAPFDGLPHPPDAWPHHETLLPWYAEAGLVRQRHDGLWESLPDALQPQPADTACIRVLNAFLEQVCQARAWQTAAQPVDDALPPLDPALLNERIGEIQCELLIERDVILRIYRALIAGQHVVLSGPPGVGKTHLATLLPRVLWRDAEPTKVMLPVTDPRLPPDAPPQPTPVYRQGYFVDLTTATEDWGVRHVIGGIAPQIVRDQGRTSLVYQVRYGCLTRAALANYGSDGATLPAEFRRCEVRHNGVHYRGQWLVIDELTRAPIDAAFGGLLTTLGGQRAPLAVPADDGEAQVPLPRDFRIIATLNSFDRHFLHQISEAMKRRFVFIDILPPTGALAAAESTVALRNALRRLHELRVVERVATDGGNLAWEGFVTITAEDDAGDAVPRYRVTWHHADGERAFDHFWRIFRAIRVYRRLGVAQAEAVCTALISGVVVGMAWDAALDAALADTLADQLQVLTRDEQAVLLAYLDHAGDAERFTEQVRAILSELPVARQRSHLALLVDADPAQNLTDLDLQLIDAALLQRMFALDSSLLIDGRSLFAQRLRTFVAERGL
jgi:5-methylcytosine-specific restriction protein B